MLALMCVYEWLLVLSLFIQLSWGAFFSDDVPDAATPQHEASGEAADRNNAAPSSFFDDDTCDTCRDKDEQGFQSEASDRHDESPTDEQEEQVLPPARPGRGKYSREGKSKRLGFLLQREIALDEGTLKMVNQLNCSCGRKCMKRFSPNVIHRSRVLR